MYKHLALFATLVLIADSALALSCGAVLVSKDKKPFKGGAPTVQLTYNAKAQYYQGLLKMGASQVNITITHLRELPQTLDFTFYKSTDKQDPYRTNVRIGVPGPGQEAVVYSSIPIEVNVRGQLRRTYGLAKISCR